MHVFIYYSNVSTDIKLLNLTRENILNQEESEIGNYEYEIDVENKHL